LFSNFLQQIPLCKICWYWYAEKKVLDTLNLSFPNCEWWDLWKVSRHVALKFAFDFSLKSFVKALYMLNKIPFHYEEEDASTCQNGQASYSKYLDDDGRQVCLSMRGYLR